MLPEVDLFEAHWLLYKYVVKDMYNLDSNHTNLFEHPLCQAIIDMGEVILPRLYHKLSNEPDWFIMYALSKITGEQAIRPENRGRLREAAEDWIEYLHKTLPFGD